MLLSFIIPAYNAAHLIIGTLTSICQEIRNSEGYPIEIVVINDGSIDNTEEVVQKYIRSNTDISINLFNKENGGLGDARNYGISQAKGKYIWFFDSDDFIEENCLSLIINKLQKDDLDLLSLGIRDCFKNSQVESNMKNKPIDCIVNGLSYLKEYQIEHSSCCYVLKKSIIEQHNIYFLKGVLSEDYDFNWRLYEKCHRITHLGQIAYNYIIRQGSLSRRRSTEYYQFHHESMIKIFSHTNMYFKSLNNATYYQAILPYYSCLKTSALIVLLKSNLPKKTKQDYLAKMQKQGVYDIDISDKMTYKQKIIAILARFRLYPLALYVVN